MMDGRLNLLLLVGVNCTFKLSGSKLLPISLFAWKQKHVVAQIEGSVFFTLSYMIKNVCDGNIYIFRQAVDKDSTENSQTLSKYLTVNV